FTHLYVRRRELSTESQTSEVNPAPGGSILLAERGSDLLTIDKSPRAITNRGEINPKNHINKPAKIIDADRTK
ncbi:MAG: hypothetical protein L3J26_13170, partial [Candidatus Polarisedimenticolaceae bacterium]|nr:hypothetical protein [Candidatus Polarisedimenticolaceae bacterium]